VGRDVADRAAKAAVVRKGDGAKADTAK